MTGDDPRSTLEEPDRDPSAPDRFQGMTLKLPIRLSVLICIGLLTAGSTALGVYYFYVYSPPLEAADAFMSAMEHGDGVTLEALVRVSRTRDRTELRTATPEELTRLLAPRFERGRVLDQRKREGPEQTFHYLVYREPDGQIYALLVAEREGAYYVVLPEDPPDGRHWYLWDYTWTN